MAEAEQANADYQEHLETYHGFLSGSKWGILGIVIILMIVLWALHQI